MLIGMITLLQIIEDDVIAKLLVCQMWLELKDGEMIFTTKRIFVFASIHLL